MTHDKAQTQASSKGKHMDMDMNMNMDKRKDKRRGEDDGLVASPSLRFPRGWEIVERDATAEHVFLARRDFVRALGNGGIVGAGLVAAGWLTTACSQETSAKQQELDPAQRAWQSLYPAQRNDLYKVTRPLTPEEDVLTYNNFYEFGSHKSISRAAQKMSIDPWSIEIGGRVEKPQTISFDKLVRAMPLEQRVLRHRCVEAWAMTVPWSGFTLSALIAYAKPLSSARYIAFETIANKDSMPGLRQTYYPWPYTEAVTIEEGMNELAFVATGAYGKPVSKQNGAPLRLLLPWKYGFKSIKSLVRISFTEKRPKTFWEKIAPSEYGFWANVNPEVPHPRWSQAKERLLGSGKKVPTRLYNGYGEFVASLYADKKQSRNLFF